MPVGNCRHVAVRRRTVSKNLITLIGLCDIGVGWRSGEFQAGALRTRLNSPYNRFSASYEGDRQPDRVKVPASSPTIPDHWCGAEIRPPTSGFRPLPRQIYFGPTKNRVPTLFGGMSRVMVKVGLLHSCSRNMKMS